MSREGEARRPTLLEPPKRSPRPSLLPTVSRPCCLPCLSAVCRSAATASPPVRATEAQSTACQGRAGGAAEEWGRACLGLDTLCSTWAAARRQGRKKGSKGLDFGLYITCIMIGTYDLLPFCNLDGQMARRGSEFHFARYHIENETDCQAFRNAFSSLLKQIPLSVDHDGLLQRWWYFFEGSLGCIGILKQWLVRALYRALREESLELTRAHLEKSVLPDAKWERMRADARSGEAEFEYADRQNSYLSDLASL